MRKGSHAAVIRLVVDNSSSSESSMPSSRAQRRSGRCHRAGIPRSGQLRTPEADISKRSPIRSGPPNLAMISAETEPPFSIPKSISQSGTFCNPDLGRSKDGLSVSNLMTLPTKRVTIWDMQDTADRKYPEFGERLRKARATITRTAAAYALRIGMNAHTYQNYERGDRWPDPDDLAKIANGGISLNWLILSILPMLSLESPDETG